MSASRKKKEAHWTRTSPLAGRRKAKKEEQLAGESAEEKPSEEDQILNRQIIEKRDRR